MIGCSMGGLSALETVLSGLPEGLPWPLVIVQHRREDSEDGLCDALQRSAGVLVAEPEDKEEIASRRIYVAPAGYHLLVEKGSFALSTGAPVLHARPSIDVLFESAAAAYGPGALAVVLTGASRDGARGAARIKARGGRVIAQDPAGAESRAMPAAAAEVADKVLPLAQIGPCLAKLWRKGERA